MKNHSAIKLAALFLFIVIGTYLIFHFNFHIIFMDKDKLVSFIESFHPFDEIVFMSLQILQVVFAPIPGEVTGFIGGYIYGPILGTLYSTIGLVIGSWLAFILARFLGLPFVEKAFKPEIIKKYDFILEHKGALVAFILFLIPGFPKDFLCYIMGLSHMRLWTFLVVSTIGRLFGTILLSVSGDFARNGQFGMLFIVLGISGILVLIAFLYREKWLEMLKHKKPIGS
jgi:uncharacterized membrane protein YdjX (TVP38/TMEM64 family)